MPYFWAYLSGLYFLNGIYLLTCARYKEYSGYLEADTPSWKAELPKKRSTNNNDPTQEKWKT